MLIVVRVVLLIEELESIQVWLSCMSIYCIIPVDNYSKLFYSSKSYLDKVEKLKNKMFFFKFLSFFFSFLAKIYLLNALSTDLERD